MGVHIFDANVPEDEKEQEAKRIFPDVRKAESRYMPVMLRDTLEGTGHWGPVRVLPSDSASSDVNVDGRILESTGRELRLAIRATDATESVWLEKDYEGQADVRAYKDVAVPTRDPFDNVYATIANDLLAEDGRCPATSACRSTRGHATALHDGPCAVRVQVVPRSRQAPGHVHASCACPRRTTPSWNASTASASATIHSSIR